MVMAADKLLLKTSKFLVYERTVELDAQRSVRPVIDHPGAVCILPLFDDRRVLLIRNYRVAVKQELIELPAGTLEPGEAPLITAQRELQEETGYRAQSLRPLLEFWMSPGILCERLHLFLATGLAPGKQSLDEGEQIRPMIVSWKDAIDMVRRGDIQDAKTLVALMHFDQFGFADIAG